jgi:DNA-binding transcriptional ArsR family regulator
LYRVAKEIPHPLPEALADLIAQRFRVLADPTRVRLLDQLRDGPATVGRLTEATGSSQQNVSKHLGILLQHRMVERRRDGTSSVYSVSDPGVFELCELVCGGLQEQHAALGEVLGA